MTCSKFNASAERLEYMERGVAGIERLFTRTEDGIEKGLFSGTPNAHHQPSTACRPHSAHLEPRAG